MTSKSIKMDSPNRPDEPDWANGYLGNYTSRRARQFYENIAKTCDDSKEREVSKKPMFYKKIAETREVSAKEPIQQSDLLKPLLLDIAENGLEAAYNNWPSHPSPVLGGTVRAELDADVIIVGAGMAGLVAAYELIRAGVKVKVLEQTDRIGGRVHTYHSENSELDAGLFGEAGAMRIPCKNESNVGDKDSRYSNSTHYLTDFYITDFDLPTQPFINSSPNTITNIYGLQELSEVWESTHFSDVWPHWNDTIIENGLSITDIGNYYDRTTGVVTDQLRLWLSREPTPKGQSSTWNRWIDIWSRFSLESFLESNWDGIVAKIPDVIDREGLEDLKSLLPWPEDAIRGYSVLSYTEQLDQSLVQYLRDQLGYWWSEDMHRIEGGMHKLTEAFATWDLMADNPDASENALQDSIIPNYTVSKIDYYYDENDSASNYVVINGYHSPTLKARAVIVATPVNILRQITFESKIKTDKNDKTLQEYFKAIEDIFTGASTKIFIQTNTRFWESQGIAGGFSKTNLPIGQVHYVVPDPRTETEKGLLLIYTWKTEALLFGALDKDAALREAVEEISVIHPEINKQYDKGIVHAWYDQPSAQGAYGLLKPRQFNNIKTLWYPVGNMFIAGETFSFATGWIQGALESGMKSAYQFYCRYHGQLKNA